MNKEEFGRLKLWIEGFALLILSFIVLFSQSANIFQVIISTIMAICGIVLIIIELISWNK